MKGEQLPPHGEVGEAELDVPLHSPEQRLVVVAEQVRGQDHHALEAVEFLHQGVAVLVDRRGAGFTEAEPPGEQAVGLVEEQGGAVMGGAFEGQLDMLGGIAQILRDHRRIVHLVERLADLVGGGQGGAGLPGARGAVEVEDAAALLRLEAADAPDLLQLIADPDGAQAVEDLLLHPAMEDQAGKFVAGIRVDEDAHFGLLLATRRALSNLPEIIEP